MVKALFLIVLGAWLVFGGTSMALLWVADKLPLKSVAARWPRLKRAGVVAALAVGVFASSVWLWQFAPGIWKDETSHTSPFGDGECVTDYDRQGPYQNCK